MTRQFCWAIVLGAAVPSGVCLAANVNHPYTNVDHSNDAGNDTGDSRVDQLNAAQLDPQPRVQQPAPPPGYASPPGYRGGYAPPPAGYGYPPGAMPQPGYAPPPPGYAPPQAYPPPG